MRDFFISPQNQLLQNWAGVSEQVAVYSAVVDVNLGRDMPCLFWLHADVNSEAWLASSISQILTGFVNPKIVILANVPDQAEAVSALRLGAVGYCHAYSATDVLQEVKAVVEHGGVWLGQDLLHHLIGISRELVSVRPESVAAALKLLTPREQEVARKASIGLSNKAIARVLDITERTVKAHLSSCFERLGVKDRLQLALVLNEKAANPTASEGDDIQASSLHISAKK